MSNNNMWETDSDDDYNDDEIIQNDVSPPDIDSEFRNNILNIKHEIYENTILKPELNTEEAQSEELLNKYIENLNNIYILCLNAQKGNVSNDLDKFPKEIRYSISVLLSGLADFFKKNQVVDTIPYASYIQKSFKEYPFIQTNSFNQE
jgi:hypothetical protein